MTLINLKSYLRYIPWVLAATLALTAVAMKSCSTPYPVPSYSTVATINPEVTKQPKVEVTLDTPKKTIKVYPKSTQGKLKIPTEAINNANIHLTDSSVIKAQERDTEVNTVLDISTGETQTYVSPLPSPWFRLENRGSVTVDYGFKRNSSDPVGRLNIHQDLLQLKQIHLGISASAFTDGDYFIGVGGSYRW